MYSWFWIGNRALPLPTSARPRPGPTRQSRSGSFTVESTQTNARQCRRHAGADTRNASVRARAIVCGIVRRHYRSHRKRVHMYGGHAAQRPGDRKLGDVGRQGRHHCHPPRPRVDTTVNAGVRLYLASLDVTLTADANAPARTAQEPPDTLPMLNLETRFGVSTPLATALCLSAIQLSFVFLHVVARCNDLHRRPSDLTADTAPLTEQLSLLELLDGATGTTTDTLIAAVHTLRSMQLFLHSVTMCGIPARAPATTADGPAWRDHRRTCAVRPHSAQNPLVLSCAENARHVRRHVLPHVRNYVERALAHRRHAAHNSGALNLGAAIQPNRHARRRPRGARTPAEQHPGVFLRGDDVRHGRQRTRHDGRRPRPLRRPTRPRRPTTRCPASSCSFWWRRRPSRPLALSPDSPSQPLWRHGRPTAHRSAPRCSLSWRRSAAQP